MSRLYELGMFKLGTAFRPLINSNKHAMQNYVKLAYYDALTFNPATN